MTYTLHWRDVSGLEKLERQMVELETRFPLALARTVNQVGRRAKTRVIRALVKQTGLDRKVIHEAVLEASTAKPGQLLYALRTRGGFIRLKYLKPRETRRGVVAKPFGKSRLYPGSFMRGGKFPNRKDVEYFGGHVWARHGDRMHIHQVRSQVRIPDEMVRAASAESFRVEAEQVLPARVDRLIARLLA